MSQYVVTDTELTAVANAIRSKGGTNADLEWPSGFIDAIEDIETGGNSATYNAVRVWTKSTGGNDASLYIQEGTITGGIFDATGTRIDLLYSSSNAQQGTDYASLIHINYSNIKWHISAIDNVRCGNGYYSTNDIIAEWGYNVSNDIVIYGSAV